MIDVMKQSGGDLVLGDTQVYKATNVLQVQLGALEYAKTFGVDLDFFLDPDFQFQNESFKSYLIQRLSESHVNVGAVVEVLQNFFLKYTFEVGAVEDASGGFIK